MKNDEYVLDKLQQGQTAYQISRCLSAFLATTIIFTAPFLLEILLNCFSFPLSAVGNLTHMTIYDSDYLDTVNRYLMKSSYFVSPYVYAFLGTLFFGIVSGLFGAFTAAVSSLVKVKYNILLFLPVFILLNLSTILSSRFFKGKPGIKWYDYMFLFDEEIKNKGFGIGAALILVAFSVIAVYVSGRKDCLQ